VASTGMARKLDDLGRIVLPAEIRRRFELSEGSYLEIQVEGDRIILSKVQDRCVFCGNADDLAMFRDRQVCRGCRAELAPVEQSI